VESEVEFRSDAPLEIIEAKSKSLKGVIDIDKRTFAFSIPIRSFEGFNNPLQKEHFNENYLESSTYPNATFTGKIIETIDFSKEGTYSVRAKGKFTIHGVAQERILKSRVIVKGDSFTLQSYFTVILEEHDISVPKIVYQKIAEEIQVQVKAIFEKDMNE
jgi:polyisoprenoid-binding protein YceI